MVSRDSSSPSFLSTAEGERLLGHQRGGRREPAAPARCSCASSMRANGTIRSSSSSSAERRRRRSKRRSDMPITAGPPKTTWNSTPVAWWTNWGSGPRLVPGRARIDVPGRHALEELIDDDLAAALVELPPLGEGELVHFVSETGLGISGGRSLPSSARCSSISCISTAGATVETGTMPLSAPQKPLNTPSVCPVATMRLIDDERRADDLHPAHQRLGAGLHVDPVHHARRALEGLVAEAGGVGVAAGDVADHQAEGLALPLRLGDQLLLELGGAHPPRSTRRSGSPCAPPACGCPARGRGRST